MGTFLKVVPCLGSRMCGRASSAGLRSTHLPTTMGQRRNVLTRLGPPWASRVHSGSGTFPETGIPLAQCTRSQMQMESSSHG